MTAQTLTLTLTPSADTFIPAPTIPAPTIPAPTVAVPVVAAVDATIDLRDGTRLLDHANLRVGPGELIVIVGPSGSGKTTLLECLAGHRPPTSGHVVLAPPAAAGPSPAFTPTAQPVQPVPPAQFGFVPQDDIVHRELTVESTVRYAARLRLPSGTPAETVDAAVDRTLTLLDLNHRRHLPVGRLSGGQRKRASIATEIVVRPGVCLLDEPTAGLDPVAAASLMDALRALADTGTAIVLSTHNLADLQVADRLVVMADGGRISYDGPPNAGEVVVPSLRPVSTAVAAERHRRPSAVASPEVNATRMAPRQSTAQVATLARRNVELMVRNRMSLAIMTGSPLLVIAMFATLFPSHAFDPGAADRTIAVAIVYWLAFAGFFFGVTFGLLQICTELPIVKRERRVTVDLEPYLVAKIIVLLPVLGLVNLLMVAVLRSLGRLPATGAHDALQVWLVLGLDAAAGLALGLLASATVASPAQAALALPMLCFPAVLFSGAVLPVVSMTPLGRAMAAVVSDRWAFEALARSLHLGDGPPGTPGQRVDELHGGALSGPIGLHLVALAAITLALAAATRIVLSHRAR